MKGVKLKPFQLIRLQPFQLDQFETALNWLAGNAVIKLI